MKRLRTLSPTVLCGTAAILLSNAQAATFTWGGISGNWSSPVAWTPAGAPPVNNITTELVFGGNVASSTWIATNDLGTLSNPMVLNRIRLQGTDADPENSGLSHQISGNRIQFAGVMPEITQTGSANVVINTPLTFNGGLLWSGSGLGTVTLNAGISGVGDITKTGTSTFRFGTLPTGFTRTPSANTWVGNLILDAGTVRFNNNAEAGASALRANPVIFTELAPFETLLTSRRDSDDEAEGIESSLRMGAVSGPRGTIRALVSGSNTSNFDIVITALTNGTYGGTVKIDAPTGAGDDAGKFIIRGPGTQTFTGLEGSLQIYKDTVVGNGATLALTDNASLFNDAIGANSGSGAVTMAGGTLKLDNAAFNTFFTQGRLRDGIGSSTAVETIGGGMLQLIGNTTSGTTENTARLQLGAGPNPRSGHLKIQVAPASSTGPLTQLSFASYSRSQETVTQFATVEFSALSQATGGLLGLGSAAARIFLHSTGFPVPLHNGLLNVTGGLTNSVGWAIVNAPQPQFASYNTTNGVISVTPTAFATWKANPQATTNVSLTNSDSTTGTGVTQTMNSLRLAAITNPGTLNIGADTLSTTAFLLTSGADYLIQATTGSIAGNGPRYFHVLGSTLTVDASLGNTQPIVKAGDGTLSLIRNNATLNEVVALNSGILRATPGNSLPNGELRFRGGQLEVNGGGTFARDLGFGPGTVNWSGVHAPGGILTEVNQDRGSGGFAAIGGDLTVNLNGSDPTPIYWEGLGFVRSGYALTFGSRSATHRVTWTDNISLSAEDLNDVNYNAREIQVINNPASAGDSARMTGTISGRQTNDLLKTGGGDLELTATNTYSGATHIQAGRLFVNGNSQTSFLHKVMPGATLSGRGSVGNVLVDAGGTITPGAADAVASILSTKDLQFTDATSKFLLEIGGVTPGGDGLTGYDQVTMDPTDLAYDAKLTLNGATLQGTFLNGFLAGVGDIFFIIINDGSDAVVGQFAQGNQVTIGSQNFNISYTADSVGGTFTGGNDVALQLVPEPSTALLLGLGTLLVSRRRRQAV